MSIANCVFCEGVGCTVCLEKRVRKLEEALRAIGSFYKYDDTTGSQASLLYDASCVAKSALADA